MTTKFLSDNIWPEIHRRVCVFNGPCYVAVAYFGQDGSKLLPLPKGSFLVVDASQGAVKSGQTCPAELRKLVKKGVKVYTHTNLHAKVFVIGKTAWTGSTNASKRSRDVLQEAALRTTNSNAVAAAMAFVEGLCIDQLMPKRLEKLSEMYTKPIVPGGKGGGRSTGPRCWLTVLEVEDYTDEEEVVCARGEGIAYKRFKRKDFLLEDFCSYSNVPPYREGDIIFQVTHEGGRKYLMSPPGSVLHVETGKADGHQVSIVHLERPNQRRKSVNAVARSLGTTQKALKTEGRLQKRLAQVLAKAWRVP